MEELARPLVIILTLLEQELTRYIPIAILPLVALIIVLRRVCLSQGRWRSACSADVKLPQDDLQLTTLPTTPRCPSPPVAAPWLVPPAEVGPDLWSAGWDPIVTVDGPEFINPPQPRVRPSCAPVGSGRNTRKGLR